jgi:hypothetical protein
LIKLYAGVQTSFTKYGGQENDLPVVQIGGGKVFFFVVVDLSKAEEADG